ncbi:alpha/beta hydrolase [Frankia sp. CcI49]|uniref:alpha/beta hydrolase n=1 Tax=Frankia sp. CcI49 TaxID=1745382 RepID=UPI000976AB32|nr:alpha/beta hydrolase [Frankia sp. CcI49]
MSDPYFDRIRALHMELEAVRPDAQQPGDPELIARLMRPRPTEAGYAAPAAEVSEVTIRVASDAFRIRIYRPYTAGADRPLLVWSHGGAFLGGDLDMPEADAVARELTARADAVVVSVDYRLCVEGVHYPAPNDDVVTAFGWAVQHAEALGADPARVSIGGASAGACLAAGAALRLRDAGEAQAASVILAYPVVHPVLPMPSTELAEKLASLTPAMAFAPEIFTPVLENYLGSPADEAAAYATPGVLAADLLGLPPTLIFNCEYDGLRASGEKFAEQLRAAGVEVVSGTVPAVLHGHLNRPGLPEADETLTRMSEWITTHRHAPTVTR